MSTTTATRTIKLIMVTGDNNNKFYDLYDHGDGTMHAEYGRVEVTNTRKDYPIGKWDSIYKAKTKKGYKDVTSLLLEEDSAATGGTTPTKDLFDISNADVKRIIKLLDSYSKQSVQQNYKVSSQAVTQAMVDEAQTLIDGLFVVSKVGTTKKQFNDKLLEIFHVIPRKMKDTRDHLIDFDIKTKDDLDKANQIVAKEQDTLDPLQAQVSLNVNTKKEVDDEVEQIDILSVMGIEMETVTDSKEIEMVKGLMGSERNLFVSVMKVKNKKTQIQFDDFVKKSDNKKTQLLIHGSRNENWISILTSGLVLRPTNAVISGKMYGAGTYFASQFKKSLGYTSLRGSYWASGNANKAFLCIYNVHVGNQLKFKHHKSWCYDLTESNLKNRGDYDSIWAEGGADLVNDELIVYNENQTTVQYIIEVER